MFFIYLIQLLQVLGQDEDPIHTSIIYGSSDLGYYYVNIYVGNPPQKQSVIIDTGSSITAFPCDACLQKTQCGIHQDKYFNRQDSSTNEELNCKSKFGECTCQRCSNNQCEFSISYSEGSQLQGFYLIDQVIFGDLLMEAKSSSNESISAKDGSVKSVFGCTTRETNLFVTQLANGIMGLSPKTNSSLAFPNIVDDINKYHKGMKLFFSICIGRVDGYMTIGQYDYSRHQQNSAYYTIQYSSIKDKIVYGVKISQIKVHNTTILAGADLQQGGGSFIDSGSTLVNAHPDVRNALVNFFVCNSSKCPEKTKLDDLECYTYDKNKHRNFEQFLSFFPTYQFLMDNNFIFDWTPRDYLTKDIFIHDAYCLPVAEYSGSTRMILGQVWMRNWDIGFNKEDNTLTFVKSNCSSDTLQHNFTSDDWFNQELNQSNLTVKQRYHPKNIEEEFLYEGAKILIVIIASILIILLILFIRRKKLAKQIKNGQKLPELEDESQKAVKQQNVVVVQ